MVKKEKVKENEEENEFIPATGKYVYVELGDLVTILAMINDHAQSNELSTRTKGLQHVVRIPSQTANEVKKFIANHPDMRQHPIGKKVLCPAPKTEAAAPRELEPRASVAPGANMIPRTYRCRCGFCPGG